jgi:hypothetical protein
LKIEAIPVIAVEVDSNRADLDIFEHDVRGPKRLFERVGDAGLA